MKQTAATGDFLDNEVDEWRVRSSCRTWIQAGPGRVTCMRSLGCLLVTCVLLTACSSGDHRSDLSEDATSSAPPAESSAAAPGRSTTTTGSHGSPDDVAADELAARASLVRIFGMDEGTQVLVESAVDALNAECMQQHGFAYAPQAIMPAVNLPVYPPDDLLAAYGYAWRVHFPGFAGSMTSGSSSAEDSDYQVALDTDCGPAAVHSLGLQDYYQVMQELANAESALATMVVASDEYQQANLLWAQCMAGYGYSYSSIDDARSDVYNRIGDPGTPEAIAIAQFDIGCERESELLETRLIVAERLQQQWIDDNPGIIERVNAAKALVIERAGAG